MAKVSVIIPMYNAKRYITGCIDALLNQTIGDVEVIVVNDCSTDDSMEICQERYGEDKRVVLVQQPRNMGPGEARNTGLLKATGEYLAFVDADDGMLPDGLLQMYETAKEWDADVVHVGGSLIPLADPMPDDFSVLTGRQLVKLYMDRGASYDRTHAITDDTGERIDQWMKYHYHWNVWAKLYRTSFIREHQLSFSELPLSEDQNFCFRCLIHAKRYIQMPGYFYIYRIAAPSISRGRKTPAFLAKVLRAAFGISGVMNRAMSEVPFFEEHPEYKAKVVDYCISCLEDSYVRQAYQQLDRKELEADEAVRGVFEQYFGDNAPYIARMFYDWHDGLPEADDMLGRMNTYEFWDAAVKAGKASFLES